MNAISSATIKLCAPDTIIQLLHDGEGDFTSHEIKVHVASEGLDMIKKNEITGKNEDVLPWHVIV